MKKLALIGAVVAAVMVGLGSAHAQSETIPPWVKNIAGYWADDLISDGEFFNFIQYLLDNGIVTVSGAGDDASTISELEAEIDRIEQETITDIRTAFDDGYQKGLRENSNHPKYSSCEDSLDYKLVTGFASSAIRGSNLGLLESNSELAGITLDYHSRMLDELAKYTTDCEGIATEEELLMLGLNTFFASPEITVEELCTSMQNDRLSYERCYDVFKPLE